MENGLTTDPLLRDRTVHKVLLDAFGQLPPVKGRDPTELEIAGFKERVATNILRFFLSTKREHKWGAVLLNALLSCTKGNAVLPDPDSVAVPPPDEPTKKGKKQDLIVESNVLVIGVENKVSKKKDDACRNPFDDYMEELRGLCGSTAKSPLLILLTPLAVRCKNTQVDIEYVTYSQLFEAVNRLLKEQGIGQESPYVSLWRDFERTMGYLSDESKYDDDVERLRRKHSAEIHEVESEMRHKVKAVKEHAEALLRQRNSDVKFKKREPYWNSEDERKVWKEKLPPGQLQRRWKYVLFDSCFLEVPIRSKSRTFIQAALFLNEDKDRCWEIEMFEERPSRLGDPPTRLKKWLERYVIKTRYSALLENLLAYGEDDLTWNTDPQRVAERFCELVCLVDSALRSAEQA